MSSWISKLKNKKYYFIAVLVVMAVIASYAGFNEEKIVELIQELLNE